MICESENATKCAITKCNVNLNPGSNDRQTTNQDTHDNRDPLLCQLLSAIGGLADPDHVLHPVLLEFLTK